MDTLLASVNRYDDIWIRLSTDSSPNPIRDRLLDALEQSGCFRDVAYERRTLRLERITACNTQGWPLRRKIADDLEALSR